jgi:hypothetical protein
MKTTLITSIILLLSLNLLIAQDSITKIKTYKSRVYLIGDKITVKGNLYDVKDSSIVVSKAGLFTENKIIN